jgi:SAM-dependent methyltransferase
MLAPDRGRDASARQRGRVITPDQGETLAYYDDNAQAYASATLGFDMVPELARFGQGLSAGASILDLGCGGGRDLAALNAAGFKAVGLDISPQLARVAEEHSGCRVVVGDIRNPPFEDGIFDGLWAAASLLHLPRREVPPALTRLRRLLRPGGRLFASVKSGKGEQRSSDGRWFTYFQPDEWRELLAGGGFTEIEIECDEADRAADAGGADAGWIQSFASAL